jgi:hypothetical protein
MMRVLCVWCLVALSCLPCFSQTITGPATTNAPCSLSNTGDKNRITINCVTEKEQGHKILAILNTILANQTDPNKEAEAQRIKDELSDVRAIAEAMHKKLQIICKSASSPELEKECEQIGVDFRRSIVEPGKATDSVGAQVNRAPKQPQKPNKKDDP